MRKALPPVLVALLISSGIISNCIFLCYYNKEMWELILSTTTIMTGCWTILLMLLVTCSDPGINTWHEDPNSMNSHIRSLSLNEEEFKVAETDEVFKKAMIYMQRQCDTCLLTRPAKGHHCNHCGYCILGFDHHCVALNNCVGRRNIRSFYMFLVVSLAFAILTLVNSLA